MKPRQLKKNSKSAMELLIKVFGETADNFSLETNSVFIKNKEIEFKGWVIWTDYLHDSDYADTCYVLSECILWNKVKTSDDIDIYPLYPICNFSFNELIKECRKLAKAGVKFK